MPKSKQNAKTSVKASKKIAAVNRAHEEARKIIAEIAEVPVNEVYDTANFNDDLGIDSMKSLELIALIEKKFRIKIPEGKLLSIRTPKSIYLLLDQVAR